jgi:HTH-type transcriptional regulator, pleiotropic regulator of extracellular virulence genes
MIKELDMSQQIPYDISYRIEDDTLRAVPNDPAAMRQAIDWLQDQAAGEADPAEQARLLGLAGACAGTLRETRRAAAMLKQAIELADTHGTARQQVTLRIRLADIHALGGRPEEAIELLRAQLARCLADRVLESLIDFAHQHFGKALLDAGQVNDGIEHLERALTIRKEKGDAELIASTEQALRVARSKG